MNRSEILEKLQIIARNVFDADMLVLHENLVATDVDEWDSLNHINFIVGVEKEFGIKFTTREVYAAETIGAFVDMIEKKLTM